MQKRAARARVRRRDADMAETTPNYGLHQWEYGERPTREDLNQDFQAIDKALGKKAETFLLEANVTALQTIINGRFSTVNSAIEGLEDRVETVIGSYTGNATYPRTISIGFTPKAVLVEQQSSQRVEGSVVHGGLITPDMPLVHQSRTYTEVVTNGFRFTSESGASYNHMNRSGERYTYLALR